MRSSIFVFLVIVGVLLAKRGPRERVCPPGHSCETFHRWVRPQASISSPLSPAIVHNITGVFRDEQSGQLVAVDAGDGRCGSPEERTMRMKMVSFLLDRERISSQRNEPMCTPSIFSGDVVHPCPEGHVFPSARRYNDLGHITKFRCDRCPNGTWSNEDHTACVDTFNCTGVEVDGRCEVCPDGTTVVSGKCVECPNGTFSTGGGPCDPCNSGYHYVHNRSSCIKCPAGLVASTEGDRCVSCAELFEVNAIPDLCWTVNFIPKPRRFSIVPRRTFWEVIECPVGQSAPFVGCQCSPLNSTVF